MEPNRNPPRDRLAEARREVARRARLLPKPPDDISLIDLPDAELIRFGLPPRPGDGADQRLLDMWRRLLSRPFRMVDVEFEFQDRAIHRLMRLTSSTEGAAATAGALGATRMGTSRNWSGALVLAQGAERFTSVWASWIVPTPQPPAGADPAHPPPGGEYQCSTWIGLDGHRLHSVSLPQMGTAQNLKPASGGWVPEVYVWHQWWTRDQDFPFVKLKCFTLEPEHEVIATLTVVTPMRVHLTIKNQDLGDCVAVEWDADSPLAPVEGLAAEWIVERPTHLADKSLLYELPDYDAVAFTDCHAATGGPSRTLEAARLIRMQKEFVNPPRSGFISVPERDPNDNTRLTLVYRDPY